MSINTRRPSAGQSPASVLLYWGLYLFARRRQVDTIFPLFPDAKFGIIWKTII